MRKLNDVLDEILVVAPELAPHFAAIQDSANYAAPEAMYIWWTQAAYVLNDLADEHPKADELAKIFNGPDA